MTSPLAKYTSRDALVYYALVLPAIVAELLFSVAIATAPGGLVLAGEAALVARLVPVLIVAASLYAVVSFRPSLLATMLIVSFFVAVSVANGITLFGVRLDLGDTVFLVIAATFSALAGFSYARGVRLLGGRVPDVTASGPAGYNLLGLALESGVPLAASLALVLLVGAIVASLGVQATHLPSPLSTLASLYLESRIGLIFTTLFVAGALIWTMRQILEPIILHFTLTPTDAKKELLWEIQPTLKSVRKVARYRPSGGLAWGILGVAYCLGITAAVVAFLPREQLFRDLLSIFTRQAPSPTDVELLLQNAFQGAVIRADILFAQSQDYLRSVIKLLWG